MHKTLAEVSTITEFEKVAQAARIRTIHVEIEELAVTNADALPTLKVVAAATLTNPWLGTDTNFDLQPRIRAIAPTVAKLLTDRVLAAVGGPTRLQAFGKAAIVGLNGEYEHGGALIHTPYFGNLVRDALEGTSILCFADQMSGAGASISVPMWHKTAAATRDFYQAMDVYLPDAPHADEISVIVAASTGPRPFARLGDRETDEKVNSEILKEIEL